MIKNTDLSKILVLLISSLLVSCAAHTNIEPVGKGKLKANANFGGPIVTAFDLKVPIPNISVGANYGLKDNLNLNANVQLLPLFYQIAGGEIGGSWYPILNKGYIPTIGISGNLLLLSSFKSNVETKFRAYPLLDLSFAWELGQNIIYTGVGSVLPFNNLIYYEDNTPMISPFVGYRWKIGNNYNLYSEIKWLGINKQTNMIAVEYLTFNNYGALGVYLSLERSF